MPPRIDLMNKKFDRLTVIEFLGRIRNTKHTYWKCVCVCGGETITTTNSLNSGHTRSCGCLQVDTVVARQRKHGMTSLHGGDKTPLYSHWENMKARCYYPGNVRYARYGGRGITVCDRWKSDFSCFYKDMLKSYFSGATLERKNNDLGYSPENCRWATAEEQNRNKQNTTYGEFNGEKIALAVFYKENKTNQSPTYNTFRARVLKRKLSLTEAIYG